MRLLTKAQELLLQEYAELNDKLFELGVTTTDSTVGEIGEYIACKHFCLTKTPRVTKAVDGICASEFRYQVKTKVIANGNFTITVQNLDPAGFDYLIICFLSDQYQPVQMFRIPARHVQRGRVRICSDFPHKEVIPATKIQLSAAVKFNLKQLAAKFLEIKRTGIIRSQRVVGDLGEYYACKRLGLIMCPSKTQKGIDALHRDGLTFEVKCRRVYTRGRRLGESRRLNNLVGKTADFITIVILDRQFACAGMWIVPSSSITNGKSSHLNIVNNSDGVMNLIPSKVGWLKTGIPFKDFDREIMRGKSKRIAPKHYVSTRASDYTNHSKISTDFDVPPATENAEGCFSTLSIIKFILSIIGLLFLLKLLFA